MAVIGIVWPVFGHASFVLNQAGPSTNVLCRPCLGKRNGQATVHVEDAAMAGKLLLAWDAADRAQKKTGGLPGGLLPAGEITNAAELRAAVRTLISDHMISLRLGIMADNGATAWRALDSWMSGLQLPLQKLCREDVAAVDQQNQPANMAEVMAGPVYLKYTYTSPTATSDLASETAYVKPYPFAGRGVLFHPDLPDGEMHMYGDLPLQLFEVEA